MAIYDCDMRLALIRSLSTVSEFNNDETYLVNELDICGGVSRADIVIVNGKLHGYEIKSQQDNLERLSSQISSYNQVFDTMTLVTCEKHLKSARKLIPKWWGIYCVSRSSDHLVVKTARKPKPNKGVSGLQLARLLWKDELLELIYSRTDFYRGLKSKSRYDLCLLASQYISRDDINDYVRETLKHRSDWRAVQLTQLCDGSH